MNTTTQPGPLEVRLSDQLGLGPEREAYARWVDASNSRALRVLDADGAHAAGWAAGRAKALQDAARLAAEHPDAPREVVPLYEHPPAPQQPALPTMGEQFIGVIAGIWHERPDYSIRQTLDELNRKFPAAGLVAQQPEQCSWTQDDEGSDAWFAGCGKGWFRLDDGTPSSNGMIHCCYCGKPLVEVPWTEPEGDE